MPPNKYSIIRAGDFMKERVLRFKRQVNKNMNKLTIQKLKGLNRFLKRSSIALLLVISILFLKKINLAVTNHLLVFLEENIKSEVNLTKGYDYLVKKAESFLLDSNKILNTFNPFKTEKYPPPISGSLYKGYKKGANEGVDILSMGGEDAKSILDGKVTNVEVIDRKGCFVTIEKENLEIKYGYLSRSYMEIGDTILKGQGIGPLGTSKDGQKYLRLEMKIDGEIVNPSEYINLK